MNLTSLNKNNDILWGLAQLKIIWVRHIELKEFIILEQKEGEIE